MLWSIPVFLTFDFFGQRKISPCWDLIPVPQCLFHSVIVATEDSVYLIFTLLRWSWRLRLLVYDSADSGIEPRTPVWTDTLDHSVTRMLKNLRKMLIAPFKMKTFFIVLITSKFLHRFYSHRFIKYAPSGQTDLIMIQSSQALIFFFQKRTQIGRLVNRTSLEWSLFVQKLKPFTKWNKECLISLSVVSQKDFDIYLKGLIYASWV